MSDLRGKNFSLVIAIRDCLIEEFENGDTTFELLSRAEVSKGRDDRKRMLDMLYPVEERAMHPDMCEYVFTYDHGDYMNNGITHSSITVFITVTLEPVAKIDGKIPVEWVGYAIGFSFSSTRQEYTHGDLIIDFPSCIRDDKSVIGTHNVLKISNEVGRIKRIVLSLFS